MKAVQRRLTYAELRLLPDYGNRYELIEGELHANGEKVLVDADLQVTELRVTPSPSERHQRLCIRLSASLHSYVEMNKLGRVYAAPFEVVFSERIALQPDIIFVSSARLGIIGPEYIVGAPDLVVEILSPHRAALDRGTKFEQYARYGVAEYWIIDPPAETVDVFRLAGSTDELKGTLSVGGTLETPLLPAWKISLSDLFAD